METTQRITEAVTDSTWRGDVADRIVRSAAQGYLAGWLVLGGSFDSLLSVEPLKGAAVAVVLSVLFALGATQIGEPTVNSFKPGGTPFDV